MRKGILEELSEVFGKNIDEIKEIIFSGNTDIVYEEKQRGDRTFIDKTKISTNNQVILDYYKMLLNKFCDIRYPNRSYIMSELMNIVPHINLHYSFTIYRFDFKDFFNSIDPKRVFQILEERFEMKRYEYDFLYFYTEKNNKIAPGIGLHNAFAEIIGRVFDLNIKEVFNRELIYYTRYVDDCILILDEVFTCEEMEKHVMEVIKEVFGERLNLNMEKTSHSSSINTGNIEFEYLGYQFQKSQTEKHFRYGISPTKLRKYEKEINEIVKEYKKEGNLDILSYKLELFFKRVVFYGTHKQDYVYKWRVRGISESYKELKRFMKNYDDYKMITEKTKSFFKNVIFKCFDEHDIETPEKIRNSILNHKYIASFFNNRALLLHSKIGLSHGQLKEKVEIFDNRNLENDDYNVLAGKLLLNIL